MHSRVPAAGVSIALLGVACAACGSHPAAKGCADLTFQGHAYVEWRVVHPKGILQEVGDGFYPACNKAGESGGDPLGGKGATDLWQYQDVDSKLAVIGLRQDTRTYVVFVRKGIAPRSLTPSG